MNCLTCDNKLKIYRIFRFSKSKVIVFEACENCNIYNYITIKNNISKSYINNKRYSFEPNNFKLINVINK